MAKGDRESLVCAQDFSLKVSRASRPARFVEAAESPDTGDVMMVTRLDRLARSTRDLLNTLAAITGKKAGFKHWRHMGGHDDIARAANADRARSLSE